MPKMLLLSHFHQPDRKRTFDYSPEIFCGNISKPFAYQTVKEFLIYRTVYHDTGYRTVNRINSFFQFIRFKFFFNFQVFGQKTGNAFTSSMWSCSVSGSLFPSRVFFEPGGIFTFPSGSPPSLFEIGCTRESSEFSA